MKTKIHAALKQRLSETSAKPNRQKFHLMADIGWISDPNGLCQHDGIYHICHQYTPAADLGLSKSWGHYTTKDWIHYVDQGTLMVPDTPIDQDGCYSGSAFSYQGQMHIFYTGNILEPGDHDYIYNGRGHYTNHLVSSDGLHFSPKEVLLKNEDYPSNMSCHVRDPKLTMVDGLPYLVLGARTKDDVGCALLYQADPNDLTKLRYVQTISTPQKFGYMWECPGLIEIDHHLFLLACPQGVNQHGYQYENVYQNGVFTLAPDQNGKLEAKDFQELDLGFDFYAPQTFIDQSGREILIGWMGIPDADYQNLEQEEGWIHCLTLPRELRFKEGRIYQYPLAELQALQEAKQAIMIGPERMKLDTRTFVLNVKTENKPFELTIRHDLRLSYNGWLFTLAFMNPNGSGYGRQARHVELDHLEELEIFSDESSIEIFLNHGEFVFSTRIYDQNLAIALQADRPLTASMAQMKAIEIDYTPALENPKPNLLVQPGFKPKPASLQKPL